MSHKYEYFISHASKDSAIVQEFCAFLQTAAEVQKKHIFCTCLPDNGLPNDEYFFPAIKDAMFSCKNIIFLISWNFLNSHDCLMELGMAHMLNSSDHQRICMLMGDVTFDDMPKMLAGIQQLGKLQEPQTLMEMKKLLYPDITEAQMPSSQWTKRRDIFLSQTKSKIEQITKQRTYKESEYNTLKSKLDSTRQKLENCQSTSNDITQKLNKAIEKNRELQKQLEEARVSVPEELIIERNQTEKEKFEDLKNSAKTALKKLPGIVQDVIYYEEYSHTGRFEVDETWTQSDFSSAVNSDFLSQDEPCLNTANRKVNKAINAIEDLKAFVENDACPLKEWLEEDSDADVSLSNRDFWNYLFN